ncbi:hypothetical protein B0H14DRAFT_2781416 [Mycena olivaceomarginata]|nr:hypothetical protein B0H14DRAFT_2781416 [Mycena olivaceomarginata]
MPNPRPILKALPEPDLSNPPLPESSSSNPLPFAACSSRVPLFSPHVHFPSTPRLTLTGDTHSPGTYDRAPITVQENACAMPERGGRVYTPAAVRPISGYFHPRAFEACEPELEPTAVPALLPDLSSETDESAEECVSPKSMSPEPRVAEEFDRALSFLPHAPVPNIKRDLGKRRNSPPRPLRRSVTFSEVEDCDGCLGGF